MYRFQRAKIAEIMHEKHRRIDNLSENAARDDFRTPFLLGL